MGETKQTKHGVLPIRPHQTWGCIFARNAGIWCPRKF